jgi:SAM-dependent methyltransferase
MADPWNINIHYDGKLDKCVPSDAASVLDVGCGDGFLAARLSQRIPRVVAVDIDQPVLERATQRFPSAPVEWRQGDILAMADELGDFDAVVSNATLHHLPDTRAALACWRYLPWALATLVIRGVAIQIRGKWEHSAPTVWPPRDTVRELRDHVRAELPGARVSLLPLGRVFIQWQAVG